MSDGHCGKKSEPWERDFFLPVPTRALEHCEKYECRYDEETVLSQVLETELVLNDEKLLCNDVPGRLWKEHSPRGCTGCLRYARNWQDAIGGWSPGQSQTYVRTTRRRISAMQARVAKMLREGHGEALGERELDEDLGTFMIRLGYNERVAQEQVERLSRDRAFVAKSQRECERLEGDSVEKELEKEEEEGELDDGEEIEVSGDDGLDWRRELCGETLVESTGTGTRNAEEKAFRRRNMRGMRLQRSPWQRLVSRNRRIFRGFRNVQKLAILRSSRQRFPPGQNY